MEISKRQLKKVYKESHDEEDLAENFVFYIEDYVELDDHQRFLESIMALPVLARRIYLAVNADLTMSGSGLPAFLAAYDTGEIRREVEESFRTIGKLQLAEIVTNAWEYEQVVEKDPSWISVRNNTDGIQDQYFNDHDDVMFFAGRCLKQNQKKILTELSHGGYNG